LNPNACSAGMLFNQSVQDGRMSAKHFQNARAKTPCYF